MKTAIESQERKNLIRSRISNKTTVFINLYTYTQGGHQCDSLCIFMPFLNEDEEENKEGFRALTDDLINYYGRPHYDALTKISQFISDPETDEAISTSITTHYRTLAEAYIKELTETAIEEGEDFIFSFLRKTL